MAKKRKGPTRRRPVARPDHNAALVTVTCESCRRHQPNAKNRGQREAFVAPCRCGGVYGVYA